MKDIPPSSFLIDFFAEFFKLKFRHPFVSAKVCCCLSPGREHLIESYGHK